MKKLLVLLLVLANINVAKAKDMNLTVNIYYTGENGSARLFADEMETSGIADAIRQKSGNLRYEYF